MGNGSFPEMNWGQLGILSITHVLLVVWQHLGLLLKRLQVQTNFFYKNFVTEFYELSDISFFIKRL